jgi:hypothetical protein
MFLAFTLFACLPTKTFLIALQQFHLENVGLVIRLEIHVDPVSRKGVLLSQSGLFVKNIKQTVVGMSS